MKDKVIAYVRLFRLPNLLIVIATQYMIRWFVLFPILKSFNLELQIDEFHFALLVLSTVLITAGGYVINDYFDRKTDLLNRPDTVVIGKQINRRAAMVIHIVVNGIAVLLGGYLSFHVGIPFLAVIFPAIVGLLWFYSTTYKRQFLIGNFIVSVLTASVPFMVVLFEIPLLAKEYSTLISSGVFKYIYILKATGAFAMFAFVTNLFREIIKDTEDFEGDSAIGRNSLPIVMGVKNTKIVIVFFIVITIIMIWISFIQIMKLELEGAFWVASLLLFNIMTLLLMHVGYLVLKAYNKRGFHVASIYTKVIMVVGLCYSIIIFYFFG